MTATTKQILSPKSRVSTLAAAMFVLVGLLVGGGFAEAQGNYVWKGNKAYDPATDREVSNQEIADNLKESLNGVYGLGQHDCESVYEAAYPGNDDTRTPIDRSNAPFVGMAGYEYDDGWRAFANVWQPEDNRIVVMPAHIVMKDDGSWITADGIKSDIDGRALRADLRFPECPGEVYKVKRVVEHGNYKRGDIGSDWLVGILDRPTCLSEDQLGKPVALKTEMESELLLPGGAQRLRVNMYAQSDRNTAGKDDNSYLLKDVPSTSGTQRPWLLEDSTLVTSEGFVEDRLYYQSDGDGTLRFLTKDDYNPQNPSHGSAYNVSTSHGLGNSGGVLVMEGEVEIGGKKRYIKRVFGMLSGDRMIDLQNVENYAVSGHSYQAGIRRALGIVNSEEL